MNRSNPAKGGNSAFALIVLCMVLFAAGFVLNSCQKELSDAQKIAALQHVKVEFDSMSYDIMLPDGALGSGMSFDSLLATDTAKYGNPANYGIDFLSHLLADNTSEDAEDAKFDGMVMDMIMDTIESSPIPMTAGPFDVAQGDKRPFTAAGAINLETHRAPGLYIFRQTVDGNDLVVKLKPTLLWTIGSQSGSIPLPAFTVNVPTRATPEMKAFLEEVLDSGVFDE